MTRKTRLFGAAAVLLLLSMVAAGCPGGVQVAQDWPDLAVDNGIVYAVSGSPQSVYLVDAETGVQKSMFSPQIESSGARYWSPVTVGGELAFVGFGVQEAKTYGLYAFDPATGQERWSVPAKDFILGAPAYADGVVYYGSSDGNVYAVDVETRSVKTGWPFLAGDAVWGSPLVEAGKVYVASLDHHLYCLDAQSGAVLWDYEAKGAMATRPTLDATTGTLYIGDLVGQVNAVKADSGAKVEAFSFQAKNWIWSEILLSGDRLFVTSLDGNLYTLDPATGDQLSAPFDGGEVLRAAPVLSGDTVIVASQEGKVTTVDVKTGVSLRYWPSGLPTTQVLTTPVVVDGVLYVLQVNGDLVALEADTSVQKWAFDLTTE